MSLGGHKKLTHLVSPLFFFASHHFSPFFCLASCLPILFLSRILSPHFLCLCLPFFWCCVLSPYLFFVWCLVSPFFFCTGLIFSIHFVLGLIFPFFCVLCLVSPFSFVSRLVFPFFLSSVPSPHFCLSRVLAPH